MLRRTLSPLVTPRRTEHTSDPMPLPHVGSEVCVIVEGRLHRARVLDVDVSESEIYVELPHLRHSLPFLDSEEGTRWARGWDEETQGALLAAWTLSQ
jgi:hypothetical protein